MATTICTDAGPFVIYHVSEAGNPDAHETDSGEWFYQPEGANDGEPWSYGYPTAESAETAAIEYVAEEIARNSVGS